MKNFIINGYTKSPTGKITNNQTMMCIVEDEDNNVLLIKTADSFYRIELDSISKEDFGEFFSSTNQPPVGNPFIGRFQVYGSGTQVLQLPLTNGATGLTIDWGDGTTTTGTSEHSYVQTGNTTYEVKISGEISGWSYARFPEQAVTMVEILDWGSNFNIDINGTFSGCVDLTLDDSIGAPIINTTNLSNLFYGCTSLITINNIDLWDTSSVTNMNGMFSGATSFNQPLSFSTENVNSMVSMFNNATSFNGIIYFLTYNVTNMSNMFSRATSFNQPLSFNTINVTKMDGMFFGATSFNQDLSQWCVTSTSHSLFDANADNWVLPKPVWGTCPSPM